MAAGKKVLLAVTHDRNVELVKRMVLKQCPDTEFELAVGTPVPEDEIIAKGQGAQVMYCLLQPLSEKVYSSLPELRAVVCPSVGYDTAHPDLATKYGVTVSNVPDYCLDEVSSHTVSLLLHLQRNLHTLVDDVRAGNWGVSTMLGRHRLSTLTVGFYGFGRLGREVAKRLASFGVTMIAVDPYVAEKDAAALDVQLVDFDQLLDRSDFITIHSALVASNRGVFGEEAFRRMKPTAFIINCARGPIIDTPSLYQALTEGWIAGAAIDVLDHEPPQELEKKLIGLPNVVVTPHAAYYSVEAVAEQQEKAIDEVVRALRGEPPRICVNPEVLER